MFAIGFGFLVYWGILFMVGVLVNSSAIEGSLIALAVICFVGGYYARSSRFVYRLCMWVGGISTAIVVAGWVLLPILQGSGHRWVTIIAVVSGVVFYLVTRRPFHRRWLRRDPRTGQRFAPPFGVEWMRWVLAFAI